MTPDLDLDSRRGSIGAPRQQRPPARGRHGRLRFRPPRALAAGPPIDAIGPLPCVISGRTEPPSAARGPAASGPGARAPAVRPAPALARPCPRARARAPALARHPAPTRTPQPRGHVDLPAGHRSGRDHRDRPRPAPADEPRERRFHPADRPLGANRTSRQLPRGAEPRPSSSRRSTSRVRCGLLRFAQRSSGDWRSDETAGSPPSGSRQMRAGAIACASMRYGWW
jgi:hypothetical protein